MEFPRLLPLISIALASGCLRTTTSGSSSSGATGSSASGAAASSGSSANTGTSTASSSSSVAASSSGRSASSSGTTGRSSTGGSSGSATSTSSGSAGIACVAGAPSPAGSYYGVLERGNDARRDGIFVDAAFTKAALPKLRVDPTFASPANGWSGPVFSQPLYFVNGTIGHDLVIVTTDSNEIWALDGKSGHAVWTVPQLVPPIDTGLMQCPGSVSPIGITGTPVIDPATRTLYLNTGTVVAGSPHYQIFGIDLDDGSTVPGWPIDVEGLTVNYAGGTTKLSSKRQNQRGALALLGGILYVPYGGLDGDCGEYRGIVLSVPIANPTAVSGWATAALSGGGIWGPSGVASDGSSVFVSTGNTNADPSHPTLWPDANSEAILHLGAGNPPTFSGNSPDYFAPSDSWYQDDVDDADLGSAGVVLFDAPGATPAGLAFAIGKTHNAYLAARGNLGGIGTGLSEIANASDTVFGSMAAYTSRGVTYVVAVASSNGSCAGAMSTFTVSPTAPPVLGPGWCTAVGGTGAPIVSTSDCTHDYVVWGLDGNLNAVDGDSGATLASVPLGDYTHWVTPIIAKGAIYVAGNNQVFKFSLP